MQVYKYYCAFAIFQSIGFLSLVAYVYLVLRSWPIQKTVEAIQAKPTTAILLSIVGPLHFIMVGVIFCLYWLKNTIAQFSLCRSKILDVSFFQGEITATTY